MVQFLLFMLIPMTGESSNLTIGLLSYKFYAWTVTLRGDRFYLPIRLIVPFLDIHTIY
jgi:hypothetical protein